MNTGNLKKLILLIRLIEGFPYSKRIELHDVSCDVTNGLSSDIDIAIGYLLKGFTYSMDVDVTVQSKLDDYGNVVFMIGTSCVSEGYMDTEYIDATPLLVDGDHFSIITDRINDIVCGCKDRRVNN